MGMRTSKVVSQITMSPLSGPKPLRNRNCGGADKPRSLESGPKPLRNRKLKVVSHIRKMNGHAILRVLALILFGSQAVIASSKFKRGDKVFMKSRVNAGYFEAKLIREKFAGSKTWLGNSTA